jgi:CRISPR-associated protein Cas2
MIFPVWYRAIVRSALKILSALQIVQNGSVRFTFLLQFPIMASYRVAVWRSKNNFLEPRGSERCMFVSVAVDPGSEGRAKELADLLSQYGFEKIQRGLWESAIVSPETLDRLKRDLDRATDAFDRLRIFQFPVNGTLALTTLRDKKWRRVVAKAPAAGVPIAVKPVQKSRKR